MAPGDQRRDEALDGWRGVACLLVFFVHKGISLGLPPLVVPGFTGVHMFFVLSGYLLSGPYLRSIDERKALPSIWKYNERRFLRIYPPYAISLLLYLAARVALGDKLPDPVNLVTHLLLIFNYFRKAYFYSLNAVYWSLAVEAQFYILLPMGAWVVGWTFRSKSGALVMGMMAVGLASRAAEVLWNNSRDPAGEVRYTSVFSYLDWFAAGMAVAWLEARRRSPKGWIAWLVSGVVVYLAGTNWHHFAFHSARGSASDLALTIGFPTLVCCGLGMILWGVRIAPQSATRPLRFRPLVWVGTISYSIFLYHIGVQVALQRAWPMRSITDLAENNLAQALASLPLAIFLSALMYWAIERPCLRAIAQLKKGSSSPGVVP